MVMNVNINDPYALINQAEAILQQTQNILRVVESLYGHSTTIASSWQSDTVDKESYLSSIDSSITKVKTLAGAMRATGNKLIAYARQQIANSNKSSN